ncbi:glycosyltransferase family 39 protein [Stenotrophomonas sp. YIM B06876]|uniref:ArnT family glycosyltransferase n=1 Tax=Stenotrophomonas sp. YIM B06876 TaxID=3060211 RepID=UPI0027385907|nr:glycosyltransferase family 39 protein [Stenotrophomonas sp. YIM B06876]
MNAGTGAANHTGLRVALLALVLAFPFLGSRGIWEPDEGRYTNVAINMVESGDWLTPRRNQDVAHWTKPPLTYWAVAASIRSFGLRPWAARLPMALSYLLCVWLTWRLARRLAPGGELTAAVAFATMLLPVCAAQVVTTDFVLAACETVAVWAFVESRGDRGRPGAWIVLMWAGFALAFLAKGPPELLPLLVVLVCDGLLPGPRRALRLTGIVVFAVIALPWYVAVMLGNPGLFEYFLGDEVMHRVATNKFDRHGQWYGWATIYGPTLALGTLPWTGALWRGAKGLPAALRRWRDPAARHQQAAPLLLTVWVLLPLLVFCLSRSRLPLYLLPLFVPLALLVAVQRLKEGRALPRWPWLALWVALLLALRLGAGYWPTHSDASAWARAIQVRVPTPVHEVIFVDDMVRYGLRLHLDAWIEKVSLEPVPAGRQARFNPTYDGDLGTGLAGTDGEPGAIWVCKQALWPQVQAQVLQHGYRAEALGPPYRGRVIFRTRKPRPE